MASRARRLGELHSPRHSHFGGDDPHHFRSRDVSETTSRRLRRIAASAGSGVYTHASQETRCACVWSVSPAAGKVRQRAGPGGYRSHLYWGEFHRQAGAQRVASELGLQSWYRTRAQGGLGIPGGESYDFGLGAGFYVDATQAPWAPGYRMYSYVSRELPAEIAAAFPVDPDRVGIFGHSMGGHGALTIALKNPRQFKSVSAFAPIVSPMNCPWGQKALTGYLGADRTRWREYDATALIEDHGWTGPPIVVDQGTNDQFLASQLKPELLEDACQRAGVSLDIRLREGTTTATISSRASSRITFACTREISR